MEGHKISFRVYYEDTDSGGVVYYANYLKFAERARTEMLRKVGINQSEEDILFVVNKVDMELKKPARLDDLLEIESIIEKISSASLDINQYIYKDSIMISELKIKIACVSKEFKPVRIPNKIKNKLNLV